MYLKQFFAIFITWLNLNVNCEGINVKISKYVLPTNRTGSGLWFDGHDSIFIFGGRLSRAYPPENANDILKYSVSKDTLETVGNKLSKGVSDTSCATDLERKNVFLIGGYGSTDIYKFDPSSSSVSIVGTTTINDMTKSGFIQTDGKTSYFFGRLFDPAPILKFDSETLTSNEIGKLPKPFWGWTKLSFFHNGSVFLLGEIPDQNQTVIHRYTRVLNYNLSSGETRKYKDIPYYAASSVAAWDGNSAYILGANIDDYGSYSPGILKYSPWTETYNFTEIDALSNITNNPGDSFFLSSVVFVEKLNRFYSFGGTISGSTSNLIFYVEQISG